MDFSTIPTIGSVIYCIGICGMFVAITICVVEWVDRHS